MSNSSIGAKPGKPCPDFPLYAHASKRWAKKVKGKLHYFGPWDDPDGALKRWLAVKDDLLAGREASTGVKPAGVKPKRPKPEKPHKDYPLYAHASGRWAKKVKGRLHYFGPWSDPQAALDKWLEQKDDLLAGREPRSQTDAHTLRDLANRFLEHKENLLASGELAPATWSRYKAACGHLLDALGRHRRADDVRPEDFEKLRAKWARKWGPVKLGNEIQITRSIFKFGYEDGLLDTPTRFGPGFKKPSAKTLRKERQKKGVRMFEADELRTILEAAKPPLETMILLGANAGFGNSDVAGLPLKALDLENGWVNFPRPKTAVERRCPLWPETVEALREWLKVRPEAKDERHADLVFITKQGNRFSDEERADCAVAKETVKLLKKLGLHRRGMGFYCLRRGFETIGGDSRDQVAVDFLMGHAPGPNDMAAVYRQRIDDQRLLDVVNHVRRWLFPPEEKA